MTKKRVFIAVDQEAWDGSMKILRELKISRQVFNEMFNEYLRGQYRVLTEIKARREAGEVLTVGAFLRMMGNIVDDLEDDQLKLVK